MANTFNISDNYDGADIFVGTRLTHPMYLPDNVVTPCVRCFHLIQHRPDVPQHLPKICLECAMPGMEQAKSKRELDVTVSRRHADEFIAWLNKKNAH